MWNKCLVSFNLDLGFESGLGTVNIHEKNKKARLIRIRFGIESDKQIIIKRFRNNSVRFGKIF